MPEPYLLPMYYIRNAKRKLKLQKFYNEKYLIVLLLILSILTVFVILLNLPSDIQKVVNKQNIQNVFIPELSENQNKNHNDQHQHPAPPVFEDKEKKVEKNEPDFDQENDQNKDNQEEEQIVIEKPDESGDVISKREKIKEMTKFAWSNYEKYAWGENELKPLSKTGHSAGIFGNKPTKLGATIVDGLDTIYLMGFMDEYKRGREWILKNLNLNVDSEFSAFEINIRFIGGLLSIYTLTKDKEFLTKAEEIATLLLPIFDTPTGIPYALINPVSKRCKNYAWSPGSCSILAEFGTLSLEFEYLSDLTGNKIFSEKVLKINQVLKQVEKEFGLYYNYLNQNNAKWCMKDASMGALGDSFYEYLYKLWVYQGKKDNDLLNQYIDAMKSINNKLLEVSPKDHLAYYGEFKSGYRVEKKMDHLSCFSGGLLAFSASNTEEMSKQLRKEFLELGKNITNTCHESYIRSPSRLGPEAFHFERPDQEAISIKPNEKYYILRPEVIESYFYLWRVTKDNKYREWAWDAAQAIDRHCRTETGFSGIKDVYESQPIKDDVQQSFFFAETLKYLYLIFSDDDVLPLDKYVFNSEAHPFLIKNSQ